MNIAVWSIRPELEAAVANAERVVGMTERTHDRARNTASARFLMMARLRLRRARRALMVYDIDVVMHGQPA